MLMGDIHKYMKFFFGPNNGKQCDHATFKLRNGRVKVVQAFYCSIVNLNNNIPFSDSGLICWTQVFDIGYQYPLLAGVIQINSPFSC